MRSMIVIAASAALLTLAGTASANEMSFGLKGGASIPLGDYSDAFGIGGMGGVYGDIGVTPQFLVGLDVNGNFHGISSKLKDDLNAAGLSGVKFTFDVVEVSAHGKWRPSSETGPEVEVGLGLYNGRAKLEYQGFSASNSDSKFGFSVGAGYPFWHNESMSLGVDASFHNVLDAIDEVDSSGNFTGNTKSAQYVSVGLDLNFLTNGMMKK